MVHSHSTSTTASRGDVAGYITGFVLAVALTAGSFSIVTQRLLPSGSAIMALALLAFVQIIVHLVTFLHLDLSRGQRWNGLALCYTALAALFLIFGTIWVMHNVSMNMMSR
ncbi:cytochrome bo3 quinol oxidase subunit 4 [Paraburkholderia sp. BL18I3N2]|uniref:cytochrome o ubiquinol oxidase subunit IV n=1 Tax=unclassified Paraburkholderia TaxID=2615204 RepID=UPI000D07ED0D|nr:MULTISPECIES: cytochrome o ubiquinol oxidase subunit IV [unclassified Paraburkholderia]PRX21745.1 cytochrome bo3 quinol oxidase subunit 4 [Paraburkholderia sp. BL18I3N2]PRX92611.1 cytochrome bo3 quinol oxidase subunit 4 [Paraburkholderia sp. BL25I1N1]TDY17217.1 cytochrome bo3 quinol oxidase subunit 4 [Paraburkholderia sp. BL6665CI2N2]